MNPENLVNPVYKIGIAYGPYALLQQPSKLGKLKESPEREEIRMILEYCEKVLEEWLVLKLRVPNPHGSQEIGESLLREILRQAGIKKEEWDRA